MAVAFRDISAMVAGTTSLTITTPSTALTNDVLIALIGDQASSGTPSPPAGWTRYGAGGPNGRPSIFVAVVGTGGVTAGQATTFSGFTGNSIGVIVAYSGNDQINPLDVTPTFRNNAAGTTGAAQAINVSVQPMVVLAFIALASGSTWSNGGCATNPTAANVTQRINAANGTTNSIYVVDGIKTNIISGTGVSSATMGTPGANVGMIVLIRPKNVGGSTNSIVTGDAAAGALGIQSSTTDSITTNDTASRRLTINSSTTDGITLNATASARAIYAVKTTDGITVNATASAQVTAGGTVYAVNTTDGVTLGYSTSATVTHQQVPVVPPQLIAGYERVQRFWRQDQREEQNVLFRVHGLHAKLTLGKIRSWGGRGLTAFPVSRALHAVIHPVRVETSTELRLTSLQMQALLGRTQVDASTSINPASNQIVISIGTPIIRAVRNLSDEDLIDFLDDL